jgi:hypothetical protein
MEEIKEQIGSGMNSQLNKLIDISKSIGREDITQACDELIHAIYSVQDWSGTYVGECIDRLEAILYQR